jgi:hypothetical protein
MIVCPVCEHPQAQGLECEVCGKEFVPGEGAGAWVPPVDGLEPTRHGDVDAGDERLAEIEPTRYARAQPIDDPTPGIEPTLVAPVDVPDDPVPGLERTEPEIPGDARTAIPPFVTCRYCRTPAPPGERVCGRCGMRLPTFEATVDEAATPPRRCGCGAEIRGPRCPVCGSRPG